MSKTIADCTELLIQRYGEWAQKRIYKGSQDMWDYFLVAYAKADTKKREDFGKVLREFGYD